MEHRSRPSPLDWSGQPQARSDPATANDRPSNSEHQATEQPRTLSDTATTNTERPGNREHRPTEHSRPPTDRVTANTERPGNCEHRTTKRKNKRRKQRKQSKPQQSTKTISSSKDRTSISTHISSYGPKPGRALGHKNLALQADQYKRKFLEIKVFPILSLLALKFGNFRPQIRIPRPKLYI